jgi:PAS domain S-box-containing protein
MRSTVVSLSLRYGCALVSILLAIGARMLLDPVLGDQLPVSLLFLAVAFTAWFGGFGPAVAAVLLGAFSFVFLPISLGTGFVLAGWARQVGMVLFLCVSLGIALLGGALHAARQRAQALAQDALDRERQLRREVERHRRISKLISDFAYVMRIEVGGKSVFEWMSDSYLQASGLTLIDFNRGWHQTIHPDDLPAVQRHYQRVISGSQDVCEYRMLLPGGQVRWLRNYAQPVWDEKEQRIVRVYGAAQDITDRKRAEEALREADRRKDEFLATLAHELRNPLAPIRNAIHLFQETNVDEAILGSLRAMMERQVQNMARLLDDLLDVSRISRGKIELRKQPALVAPLLDRTVEALRPLFEERRHELSLTLPPVPLQVEVDPTRFEQIMMNLLTNAVKYTEPGGRIELSAERDGAWVVLRVRDTGIGIPSEMLSRVFDLFVQVERRLDRAQGGVGIGLTLVRKLVELHGGQVEAHSAGPGLGSEFVVRLPAYAGKVLDATPEPGPPAPGRTRTCRVLIVDDNQDAANSLAHLLRIQGQEVQVAFDGPSALTVASDFQPAMALLDLGMPGMDGYELAQRLRQQPGLERLRLIALTGWGQEEDRRRSREVGFDLHRVKPVEPEVLRGLFLAGPGVG